MKNWKFTVMSEGCNLLGRDTVIVELSVETCSSCCLLEGSEKGLMGILEFDVSEGAGRQVGFGGFYWINIVISDDIPPEVVIRF